MVGEYIRSLRTSAGFAQRELADRVGISASMLSLVESGRRDPTIRLLREISRALEVPSAALFAAALAEESSDDVDSPLAQQLREMTSHLLAAAQHAIVLRRLKKLREEA